MDDDFDRVIELASQVRALGLDGKLAIRDALNKELRENGLNRISANINARKEPIPDDLREDAEFRFFLTTRTQTRGEGESVVKFIEFIRSAYVHLFTEFTKSAVMLEDFRKSLDAQDLNHKSEELFYKFGEQFFLTMQRVHNAREHFMSTYRHWHQLRGHTPEEQDKLAETWKELVKKMR